MKYYEVILICVVVYTVLGFLKMKLWDAIRESEFKDERRFRGIHFSEKIEYKLDEVSVMFHGMQKNEIDYFDYPYQEVINCNEIHQYALMKLSDLDHKISMWTSYLMSTFLEVADHLNNLKNNQRNLRTKNIQSLLKDNEHWQHLNSEFDRFESEIRSVIKNLNK